MLNRFQQTVAAIFLAVSMGCSAPREYGTPPTREQEMAQELINMGVGSEGYGRDSAAHLVFLFAGTSRLEPDHEQQAKDWENLKLIAKENPAALREFATRYDAALLKFNSTRDHDEKAEAYDEMTLVKKELADLAESYKNEPGIEPQ